jgi:phosphoadenosine phosphosulfate reductase
MANAEAGSSAEGMLKPQYSASELEQLNEQLAGKSPQEILKWSVENVEGLYQTTAFGL